MSSVGLPYSDKWVGTGGSESTPALCGDSPRRLSQGSLTHVVPQVTTEEARAAEHSVHWLRPPNGIDREAIAMMMEPVFPYYLLH